MCKYVNDGKSLNDLDGISLILDPSILNNFSFCSPVTLGIVIICEFSMLNTLNSYKKSTASFGRLFKLDSLMYNSVRKSSTPAKAFLSMRGKAKYSIRVIIYQRFLNSYFSKFLLFHRNNTTHEYGSIDFWFFQNFAMLCSNEWAILFQKFLSIYRTPPTLKNPNIFSKFH